MPDTQEMGELLRVFSPGRMQPYVAASGGDIRAAFRLYAWNVAVSAAFSGPLHCLEVILRNAMHHALAAQFGREDWWRNPSIRLHSVAAASIAEAPRQDPAPGQGRHRGSHCRRTQLRILDPHCLG
jgi:hypothetical protein